MRVFVSYTSKDSAITKEVLSKVETRLKLHSKVFIDILHNNKGKQCRVDFELRRCNIFLQLVSQGCQSECVSGALLTARRKNIPVVKTTIDDLLNMDDEQILMLLTDVEKKGWPIWLITMLSLLGCLAVSMIGIWLSYEYVSFRNGVGEEGDLLNARGLFGDSWGGVNAIVSAFAFAGVIVTLFLQNRDLNLQRKEMARQREEFEKENETLKYQRFENLLYNMLNLQQEIVAGLKFNYTDEQIVLVPSGPENYPIQDKRSVNRTVTGREVFRYTFERVELDVPDPVISGNEITVQGYRRFLNNEGIVHYDATWIPTYFDHYFRHLYKIVQFIDSQGFQYNEAYKYTSLLRGTLSRYELIWLYYNALNPSYYRFKILIEKYSLLKNLREDLLTSCEETKIFYQGLGLSPQAVKNAGFSAKDFEFFLSDDSTDRSKYYLSAFWKRDDIQKGQEHFDRWKAFINKQQGLVGA